jgi:hypothetical protein
MSPGTSINVPEGHRKGWLPPIQPTRTPSSDPPSTRRGSPADNTPVARQRGLPTPAADRPGRRHQGRRDTGLRPQHPHGSINPPHSATIDEALDAGKGAGWCPPSAARRALPKRVPRRGIIWLLTSTNAIQAQGETPRQGTTNMGNGGDQQRCRHCGHRQRTLARCQLAASRGFLGHRQRHAAEPRAWKVTSTESRRSAARARPSQIDLTPPTHSDTALNHTSITESVPARSATMICSTRFR